MDFVFGSLVNDTLKLASHRAERRGIQHGSRISPLDPTPDDAVTVDVITESGVKIDQMALIYATDGREPAGSRGRARHGQVVAFQPVETTWDTLVWGYVTRWQATIPAQPENTLVQYIISAWAEGSDEIYADWPDTRLMVEHQAQVFFNGVDEITDYTPGDPAAPTVFAYHVDRVRPPEWAQDAIIYHIFLDSFYPGDDRDWQQTDDLAQVVGGTLWGVRDKLDYLAELGITCIWLSPVWASPTNHGYDATDYTQVEPRLGGNDALHAVVAGAHERGIRVLLDIACNHISNAHPYFQDAQDNPNSPYRDWFIFDESDLGYAAFFGVETMPEVNLSNPGARDWLIGVATHYLTEYDVDGYRLDYANGPGPTFWTYFHRACKAAKPDCLLFGEIIDVPDKLAVYTGRLDGSLDFNVNDALRRTYAWKSWTPDQLEAFLERHTAYFPADFVRPSFLDNHDMDRFSYISDGDTDALKAAAKHQFALPGIPIIYYGTEVGVNQRQSTRDSGLHVSRVPMPWGDDQDADLLAFYRDLIAVDYTRPT